jgi:nucleoporin p58/p45
MTFRNSVKTQKGLSSDIARGSGKPLHKIQEDTESLKQMLAGLTSGFQRNGALADKLKADTAKVMQSLYYNAHVKKMNDNTMCDFLHCV